MAVPIDDAHRSGVQIGQDQLIAYVGERDHLGAWRCLERDHAGDFRTAQKFSRRGIVGPSNLQYFIAFGVVDTYQAFAVEQPGAETATSRRGFSDLMDWTFPTRKNRDLSTRGDRERIFNRVWRVGFQVSSSVDKFSVALRSRASVVDLDLARTLARLRIEQE